MSTVARIIVVILHVVALVTLAIFIAPLVVLMVVLGAPTWAWAATALVAAVWQWPHVSRGVRKGAVQELRRR